MENGKFILAVLLASCVLMTVAIGFTLIDIKEYGFAEKPPGTEPAELVETKTPGEETTPQEPEEPKQEEAGEEKAEAPSGPEEEPAPVESSEETTTSAPESE